MVSCAPQVCLQVSKRVTNPLQVANLPHKAWSVSVEFKWLFVSDASFLGNRHVRTEI
jgi:hypothetical protein